MFGSGALGQSYFGETFVFPSVTPGQRRGIGGSGMSDEEYEALLRRMGASHPTRVLDDELVDAVAAMRLLNLL